MRGRGLEFAFLLLAVAAGLGTWWLGPWRLRTTLADGAMADGARFRVVQGYKDIADPGWVVGIYLADANSSWKLRWTMQADSPWKSASVTRGAEGWGATVETGLDSFSITQKHFLIEVPNDLGWSFAAGATCADMEAGLLHTTY